MRSVPTSADGSSLVEVDAKSVLQHAPATYNNKKPDLYRFIVYYKGEHTEDNMAILIMYDFNKRQTIVSTNKSMDIPEEAIIYFVAKATTEKIEIYDGYIDYIVEECTKDDRNQNAVVYRDRSNPIYKQ